MINRIKARKYLKAREKIEEASCRNLVKTAEETVRLIGQALSEGKVTPEDAGEMNAILVNIMEYLYGKYGNYSEVDQEVKNMIKTFYNPELVEKGRQEGIQKGIQKGSRLILLKLIRKRFGAVPEEVEEMINCLEMAHLEALAEKILEITTEEELRRAVGMVH